MEPNYYEDKRELNFNDSEIKYLPELINFTNLHSLCCSNNDLIFLPTLPPRLELLVCDSNKLISLPVLPENLKNLYCFSNILLNLPTLPENLSTLDCKNNYIENLPSLPVNLSMLDCSNNRLMSLPSLPESLIFLQCNENCLTSLPRLPESLKLLHCEENALTHFPDLPDNLVNLSCERNRITCLHRWPQNLSMAFFNYNPLVMLPDLLPVNLTHLHFFKTPLFEVIKSCEIDIVKKKLHTLHKFRDRFHALKCRRPLRKLLWEKVRGPKLEKLYHPKNLEDLLKDVDDDDEDTFHKIINNWIGN